MTTPLGPGAEFDVVRRLTARWGPLASGIGDDAAVLDVPVGERLVVSTDTSVERVHFRREWLTPAEIGWRATTAALSDLAAMGARPLGVLLALTVPASWRSSLDALADGVGEAVRAAGTHVVGGDLTAGDELALAVTVLGAARRPVLRGGAVAGDTLWVTGRLGAPRAALSALLAGGELHAEHRSRFARPEARIAGGAWLAAHGATAMIDVSDGLIADLRHLATASGVALHVDAARVPRVDGVPVDDALASGEEYELAVTLPPPADAATFAADFERATGIALTAIGAVATPADDAAECIVVRGLHRVDLPSGHDHFSR